MKFKKAFIFQAFPRYRQDTDNIREPLRYDRGFISDKFPGLILFGRIQAKNGGTYGESPTIPMWHSEGYVLRNVDLRQDNELYALDMNIKYEDWFTYRRVSGGYEKVSLAKVLAFDDFPALDEYLHKENKQ